MASAANLFNLGNNNQGVEAAPNWSPPAYGPPRPVPRASGYISPELQNALLRNLNNNNDPNNNNPRTINVVNENEGATDPTDVQNGGKRRRRHRGAKSKKRTTKRKNRKSSRKNRKNSHYA